MNKLLLKSLVLVACLMTNALFGVPARATTDCTQTHCYFMALISSPSPPVEVVSSGGGCSNFKGSISMKVSGKIRNISDKPVSFVHILVNFFDATGEEVGRAPTGMPSLFVNPGESVAFGAALALGSAADCSKITRWTMEVTDWRIEDPANLVTLTGFELRVYDDYYCEYSSFYATITNTTPYTLAYASLLLIPSSGSGRVYGVANMAPGISQTFSGRQYWSCYNVISSTVQGIIAR